MNGAIAAARWARGAALVAVALSWSSVASAGEYCESHFPELRSFVEQAGGRTAPDSETADVLANELAIERALWSDETTRHRSRLETFGASLGIARLDAVDAEIKALFDQLELLLIGRSPLDKAVIDPLLACGDDGSRWRIRSSQASSPEIEPVHREVVIAAQPPPGYHHRPDGAGNTTTKADPADIWPDDPLHPIVVKAAELGHDPVAAYRFVLNEIRAEHSFGSLKSPEVVLASGSGNDADQSMLLAELLRASGYPARLAKGVVEYPTDRLISHFAVTDHVALEDMLTTMGASWSPVGGGARPAAYRVERFWCEVWIAFANFRGLELDDSGETWAVLDPEFEDREALSERRILGEMAFEAAPFLDDYLTGGFCSVDLEQPGACPPPREIVSGLVNDHLTGLGEPATYETLVTAPAVDVDELPILPASMPGHIVSVDRVGLSPADEDRHRIRLIARDHGLTVLDAEIPLSELTGREAAIWYAPATSEDEQIVRAFDNDLWGVPPYLINVTPTVIHRGGEVVRGHAGIAMGHDFELEIALVSPSGSSTSFLNREIAGVPAAIGMSTGATGFAPLGDVPESSLELSAFLADGYLSTDHRFASEIAILGGHGIAYPRPSVAFVGNDVLADGALGLIQIMDWKGLTLDVDVWGPRAAGGSPGSRQAWRTLAQLGASVAERGVFEAYGVTSVSADLALIVAADLGVDVVRVDAANLATVLPSLPYPNDVLSEIEAWVLAGGHALVSEQPVNLRQWNGVGFLLFDPDTGEARYQLAGALSGGSTTDPPDEAQSEFGLDLWPPTRFPVNTDPASVTAIGKLAGFDGAEGTVGTEAEIDLQVEALDGRGARVQGVPVDFSSVAGGGEIIDESGAAHDELTVLTDDHGIATVGFRFGTDTEAGPIYALQHPGDEHASQALLHFIDAVGHGFDAIGDPVELPINEPFWAVAFPDEPASIRRTDTDQTHFIGTVAQWSDTMYLSVEDQYGNPVSNVPVSFDVGSIQHDAACSNALPPGLQINAAVFDNLMIDGEPACGGHPVLGSCGGPSLTKSTSFTGVSAGVIEGNVVAATYAVNVTTENLIPLAFTYSQNWTLDAENQSCDTPDRFRVSSSFLTDEAGRNVNAAAVGETFQWDIDFWIEYFEPEPRPGGDPPFYAGGGAWWPTCGDGLAVAVGNGGSASPPLLDTADWSYSTNVTTGALPGINEIRAVGGAFHYCTTGTPVAVPLDAQFNSVWGIQPAITGFDPPLVVLTPDDALAQPLRIDYRIDPIGYSARTVQVEVRDLDDASTTFWPGSSPSEQGSATLPRGQVIEFEHDHVATVVVNPNHPAEVLSPERPLPLHEPIFRDVTTELRVSQELDVINRTTCAEYDIFSFHVNHTAAVTLTITRETPTGPGPPEVVFNDSALPEGDYALTVSPSSSTPADITLLPGNYDVELYGVSQGTTYDERVAGTALSNYAIRDALPVGHAMVKGVDLFDGHLVLSREDLSVPTRGVPLSFERSYSSSSAEPGHMGQGWTHNWLARVVETPCGDLILIGTEGSGMRFTPDGAGGWKPPKGYHGTLIVDDSSDEIDFFTTGGTRYHFLPVTTLAGQPLGEWYLDFVENSSRNRTRLIYEEGSDGLPRVKRVQGPAARELVFHYEERIFQYWGGDVLVRVEGPDVVETVFDYDGRGNLIEARRENGVRIESYGYDRIAFRDVLTSVTNDLNGAATTYEYSNEPLGFADVETADIFLVQRLTEPEGGTTQFFYDTAALAAGAGELTTWVRDPRDSNPAPPSHVAPGPYDTTYTLNSYGSPTAITDPLGHATTMQWDFERVVMDSRTDANDVTTTFNYDDNGNLLTEVVTVTDVDGGEHEYTVASTYKPPSEFDPPYIKNRVATHTDRNEAKTTFSYDTAGRLTESSITVTTADGAAETLTTSHGYDPANGDRLWTRNPRGHTTEFGYDVYGNLASSSIEVFSHDGTPSTIETQTRWDALGRPLNRTDPEGHVTAFMHDTLGRLTKTTHPEVEIDIGVYWNPVEETVYDDAANTVTSIDANGHATVSTFDLQGRLVNVTNPEGGQKIIHYDPAGNKDLESTFHDASTPRLDTAFGYDEASRLVQRFEPDGRLTSYDYDPVGNLIRETLYLHDDPSFIPRVTEHDYDQLNRRIRSVRDPPPGMSATTELLLDGEGRVVRERDPEGRATFHHYDELGRRIETVEPEWRVGRSKQTQFFYDGNGNLEREIRFNQRLEADGVWSDHNQVRMVEYDELDRPIVSTDAEGHQTKSRYDRSGNLVEEINRRGHVTEHAFDALNRRTSTTQHLSDLVTGLPWDVVTRRIFDAAGNLRHEILPNGNRLTHRYDALDRLTITSDTIGPVVSYAYDARGNKVEETDANGHTTAFHYDSFDRLIHSHLPDIRDLSFGWDIAGNRTFERNGRGARTDFQYDSLDRVVLVEYPEIDGVRFTSSSTFDLVGNQLTATDRNGHTTEFIHDDLNRVITVVDPQLSGPPFEQYSVSTTYDAVGNRVAETDRRGFTTRWVYDRENRLVKTYRNEILIARTGYDPAGNAEFVTDANGNTTHTVFDERDLEVRIEQPDGVVTTLFRNEMGDTTRELDPEGKETVRGFDLRRRLASETNGENETTAFGYDFVGNLTTVTRPRGQIWTRVYDQGNRLRRVVDPFNNRTAYEWDGQDNLKGVVDTLDRGSYFQYDALDRMVRSQYPDGASRSFSYDGNGNRLTATDPKGQTVSSLYDELNREVVRSFSSPIQAIGEVLQSIGFSWDENSNLVDAIEQYSTGTRLTHHEWDGFDRLDRVVDGFGKVLDYGYDLNGNRTSLVDPDGADIIYTYDGLNRVDTVVLPGGAGIADYDWYRNGLPLRVTYPNGTTAHYTFDGANRVTAIENQHADGSSLSSFGYDYDVNGNRILQTEANGGVLETTTYSYDDNDRLWQVQYPDRTTTYGFDAVGNRLSERATDPSGDPLVQRIYAYDSRNRLTSIDNRIDPTQSVVFAHDLNGNRVQRTQAGTTLDFRYDVRDQLLEVDHNGSPAWTFSFDYRGLRVSKWGADGLLNYTYDDTSVLQQHSAIGDPVATYRYGPDRLLATDHHSQGLAYYHFDTLGSVANLTDPTGAVLNRYQYDAWGNHRTQSGSHWNPFEFTGHEYDEETGLYYAKARFYDPEVGRFLTEDPAQPDLTTPPSLHRYLYAYGNPTVYVDPDGRISILSDLSAALGDKKEAYFDAAGQNTPDESTGAFARGWRQFHTSTLAMRAGLVGMAQSGVDLLNLGVNTSLVNQKVSTGISIGSLTDEASAELLEGATSLVETVEIIREDPKAVANTVYNNAKDVVKAAAEGDHEAQARVQALLTEVAVDLAIGSKGLKSAAGIGAKTTETIVDTSLDIAKGARRAADLVNDADIPAVRPPKAKPTPNTTPTTNSAASGLADLPPVRTADSISGKGAPFGGRSSRSGGEILEGASWHRKGQAQRNRVQGLRGEDVVRARLLENPYIELVGEQIRVRTPGEGSYRITDFLVRGKSSEKLRIVEVKTGEAVRSRAQLAKDGLIADPFAPTTFFGRRARAAGYPNGMPTGSIPTFEINASHLRSP